MAIRDRITEFVTYLSRQVYCSKGGIVLGRVTGDGPTQEITVGSGLTLSGTTLTANVQNLTSGPVRSTNGTSSIADGALSIAKTSGLQTALDGKSASGHTHSLADFSAISSTGGNGVSDNGKLVKFDSSGALIGSWFSFPTSQSQNSKTIHPLIYPPYYGSTTVGADFESIYKLPLLSTDSPDTTLAKTSRSDGLVSYDDLVDVPAAVPLTASKAVANAAARLALSEADAEGFAVVDSDTGKTWMLVSGGNPSVSGDWLQLGDRDIQWGDVGGKPTTFAPETHTQAASTISDSTAAGRALLTAADALAQKSLLDIRKPSLIAFFGDSITDLGAETSGTYATNHASGFLGWTQFFLNGRAQSLTRSEYFSEDSFGYSGYKINQLRNVLSGGSVDYANSTARTAAEVLGSNGPLATLIGRVSGRDVLVVELSGANDISDIYTYTAAQVAAKRKALWQEMIACGIPASRIAAIAILPYADATKTAFGASVNTINQADAASLGINWIAYPAAFLSAGAPVASYYVSDLIHPNKLGAFTLGQTVATAITSLVATDRFALPVSTDSRWLTANPYVTGTSAVSGTRYSGNLATSWSVPFAGTANTSTTLSKVTDSEGEWQRVVVTGTERDGGIAMVSAASPATIPAGTRFRMVMRAKGSGFQYVKMALVVNSVAVAFVGGSGSDLVAVNPNDLVSFDGVFVGPVIVMPGGQRDVAIWVAPVGQGTLDFRQVGLLRVEDTVSTGDIGVTIAGMVATGTPPAISGIIKANAAAGAITVNLPAVSGVLGRRQTYIKTDASGNAVTLDGNGSETVGGASTIVLSAQGDKATIVADSSGWLKESP